MNAFSKLALMMTICSLSLNLAAQELNVHSTSSMHDRWQWASSVNQASLRVVALDVKRQQVVVAIENGELSTMQRGTKIRKLAVELSSVTSDTVVFKPIDSDGRNAIMSVTILLNNGKQVTMVSRLVAPSQSITPGWMVVTP